MAHSSMWCLLLLMVAMATVAEEKGLETDVALIKDVSDVDEGREMRISYPSLPTNNLAPSQSLGGLLALGLAGTTLALFTSSTSPLAPSTRRSDGFNPHYVQSVNAFERKISSGIQNRVRAAKRRTWRGLRRVGIAARRSSGAASRGIAGIFRGLRAAGRAMRRGVRGWRSFGRAYARGVNRLGKVTKGGFRHVGRRYTRGLQRLNNMYQQGVNRVGMAASNSVDTINDLASLGAQRFGGLATEFVDVASKVPDNVAKVARERMVQNCILQTICYAAANDHRAHRSLRTERLLESLGSEARAKSASLALSGDDCDAFDCQIVSFGKKAYGLVNELARST